MFMAKQKWVTKSEFKSSACPTLARSSESSLLATIRHMGLTKLKSILSHCEGRCSLQTKLGRRSFSECTVAVSPATWEALLPGDLLLWLFAFFFRFLLLTFCLMPIICEVSVALTSDHTLGCTIPRNVATIFLVFLAYKYDCLWIRICWSFLLWLG